MSELDNAINSINASATKASKTASFLDQLGTYDENSNVTNPNNGAVVPSIQKKVKDTTEELFANAESDINAAVATATGAVNFAGAFVSGSTSAIAGKSYSFDGGYWTCVANTTSTPSLNNSNWRKVIGQADIDAAEERAIGAGVSIYRGSNGSYVQNGDVVPAGATHLAVVINGKVETVAMSPVASGAVSLLTETSATIGATPVIFSRETWLASFDVLKQLSLPAGYNVKTINYYSDRDGGGNKYRIYAPTTVVNINGRQDQPASFYADTYGAPTLPNGNIAIPLLQPTPKRWGAISDSITYNNVGTDSSAQFQEWMKFCAETSQPYYLGVGKFYAHDLTAYKNYNATDATGSTVELTPRWVGKGKGSSIIYTNGNNWLDVLQTSEVYGENFSVISDRRRVPSDGEPLGYGLWSSSLSSNYIIPKLKNVALDRFEYSIKSDLGSWGTDLEGCDFRFVKVVFKAPRLYSARLDKCNFIAKTVLDTDGIAAAAVTFSDNHIALGTYASVFGGVEETFKLDIESFTWDTNYLETYANLPTGSVIFDINFVQQARGVWRGTRLNLGQADDDVIIRRIDSVIANLQTDFRFEDNRIIKTGQVRWWESGLTVNQCYIEDDIKCDLVGSKIIPFNEQVIVSYKGGIVISEGEVSIGASEVIDTASLLDVNLIDSNDDLTLRVGLYNMSVFARSSGNADVSLRFSRGGINIDFPIAVSGSLTKQASQAFRVPFEGAWDVQLVNSLGVGQTATISDLVIQMEPNAVFKKVLPEG